MAEEKINYQNKMEEYHRMHPERVPLALHSCCGPCSSYVLECLLQWFDVTLFYYNPNIHPEEEYLHRMREQERLCREMSVTFVTCDYDPQRYFELVRGLEEEKEGGARCSVCFRMRLEYTARLAKKRGIQVFTTTLTVSPHKNAQIINPIGEAIASEYGLTWLPADFKKKNGYKRSIELSKEHGLYRQDYCGCVFSNWHKKSSL